MQALRLAQHRKVNHRLCQTGRKDAAHVICPEGLRDKTRARSPAFCIEWFRPAEGRARRQRCRCRPDEGTAKSLGRLPCTAPRRTYFPNSALISLAASTRFLSEGNASSSRLVLRPQSGLTQTFSAGSFSRMVRMRALHKAWR